jgi:Transglycosylase SLT domain
MFIKFEIKRGNYQMSRINNLQPKAVDSSSLPINATKTVNANQANKQANAAINQLTNRFAEMQNAQPQQTDDLSKPIQINPKTDFPGKKIASITQQDALRVMYEKLADKAKLNEPYRREFIEELTAPKSNIVHLDTNQDFTPDEFNKLKKGEFSVTPSENTVKRLQEYQAKQNLPDNLIAKYQKPFGQMDEVGLGKELAQLSTTNFREVQEVLNRLKKNENFMNQGQSLRVADQMLNSISDADLLLLAQKGSGNEFLQNLSADLKASNPKKPTLFPEFEIRKTFEFDNAERIDNARQKAIPILLGDNSVSLSNWENPNSDKNSPLNRLKVLDEDKTKAREIFNRMYPNAEDRAMLNVKNSQQSKELDRLEKLVTQNRYNQIIDKTVTDLKPIFPQLDEKTLKALLIQESGLNPDPTQSSNNPSFRGVGQMNSDAAKIGGITDEERLDPAKAIPAAARILKAKADYLEGNVSQRGFIKYGRPQESDYMKFVLAAYNAGEGAIARAIDLTYQKGLTIAKGQKLNDADAETFAKSYATKWENIVDRSNPSQSPLAQATSAGKYKEVRQYVDNILELSKRQK